MRRVVSGSGGAILYHQQTNRRRFQYCRVIIITSLVWFMFDVFLLMYFADCTGGPPRSAASIECEPAGDDGTRLPRTGRPKITITPKPLGLLDRFLPDGLSRLKYMLNCYIVI